MLPTVPSPSATRLELRAASNSRTPERQTGVPLSLVILKLAPSRLKLVFWCSGVLEFEAAPNVLGFSWVLFAQDATVLVDGWGPSCTLQKKLPRCSTK